MFVTIRENVDDQVELKAGQAWEFSSLAAACFYCEDEFLKIAVSRHALAPEFEC